MNDEYTNTCIVALLRAASNIKIKMLATLEHLNVIVIAA
jgi:hypothetical protein